VEPSNYAATSEYVNRCLRKVKTECRARCGAGGHKLGKWRTLSPKHAEATCSKCGEVYWCTVVVRNGEVIEMASGKKGGGDGWCRHSAALHRFHKLAMLATSRR
jgi:hypothetical protein